MKKMILILTITALVLSACAAFAEDPDPEAFVGKWFVNRVDIGDITYDTSETSNKTVFEFNAGRTGYIYEFSEDNQDLREFSWIADPAGETVWITETADGSLVAAKMVPDGDGYIIRYDDKTYVLGKNTMFETPLVYGMYAVYDYTVPEEAGQDEAALVGDAVGIINSRLQDHGYEGAAAWLTADFGIRVEIPGIRETSVLDLISAEQADPAAAGIQTSPLPLELSLRKVVMVTDVRHAEQIAAETRERAD